MYNIELNIRAVTVELVHAMREIGEANGFKVHNHGWDRLVFESDRGVNFAKLIDELNNVCRAYGVQYVDLLDLD